MADKSKSQGKGQTNPSQQQGQQPRTNSGNAGKRQDTGGRNMEDQDMERSKDRSGNNSGRAKSR